MLLASLTIARTICSYDDCLQTVLPVFSLGTNLILQPFPYLKMKDTTDSRMPGLSMVFEGCSWGCVFYCGLWGAAKKSYTKEQIANGRFGGSSSGCLAALGACLDREPKEVEQMYFDLANLAELYGVMGYMSVYHEVVLRKWLPKGGEQYKQLQVSTHTVMNLCIQAL